MVPMTSRTENKNSNQTVIAVLACRALEDNINHVAGIRHALAANYGTLQLPIVIEQVVGILPDPLFVPVQVGMTWNHLRTEDECFLIQGNPLTMRTPCAFAVAGTLTSGSRRPGSSLGTIGPANGPRRRCASCG